MGTGKKTTNRKEAPPLLTFAEATKSRTKTKSTSNIKLKEEEHELSNVSRRLFAEQIDYKTDSDDEDYEEEAGDVDSDENMDDVHEGEGSDTYIDMGSDGDEVAENDMGGEDMDEDVEAKVATAGVR